MKFVQLTNGRGAKLLEPGSGAWVVTIDGWDNSADLSKERVERLRGGTFRDASRWAGRALTVRGAALGVLAHDEVRRVASILQDLAEAELVVERGSRSYACTVQADGQILGSSSDPYEWTRWQIPLWCADGRLYGPEKRQQVHPMSAGVGLSFPLFGGLDGALEWGTSLAEMGPLVNDGTADAWPVFEVHTDSEAGFRVAVGGSAITYSAPCVASTPVIVDSRGTVTVGGVDHTSRLTERGWPTIPAKGALVATFETLDRTPGFAWASLRDTYL